MVRENKTVITATDKYDITVGMDSVSRIKNIVTQAEADVKLYNNKNNPEKLKNNRKGKSTP